MALQRILVGMEVDAVGVVFSGDVKICDVDTCVDWVGVDTCSDWVIVNPFCG